MTALTGAPFAGFGHESLELEIEFRDHMVGRSLTSDSIDPELNSHRRHSALDYLSPINYERSRSTAFRTSPTPSTETG